jgi:hypothetical protein
LSSAIGVIQGLHAVIGGLSRQPHWFLNDADAQRYGRAMANAARHFPLRTTQKALDVSMLLITAFSIEAPRVVMSMQLARSPLRSQPQPQRGPAQVFQFINPNAPASPTTPSAPPPPSGSAGATAPSTAPDAAPVDRSAELDAIGGEPVA